MTEIRIPSGMRDILSTECEKKEELRNRITSVYKAYGYRPVETPLIEFYSTYQNTFTSLKEETLYKFVDESGQLLVLRTDMTLPIARLTALRYRDDELPLRFSYCAPVYKVRQTFAGKRNEVTDCGIELIGLDSDSDLEVLACALDVMAAIGAKNYTLEIGSGDFFRRAAEECGISKEDTKTLADLIDRKEIPALKQFVASLQLNQEAANFFEQLPFLAGKDALVKAEKLCFAYSLKEEAGSLLELKAKLEELGYGEVISFDLGKVPHLDYYTGIIFEGYIEGFGSSVLSGGRYDGLLNKLGRDLPAIGFGVKLDYLLETFEEPKTYITKLYYPKDQDTEAIRLARELRKEGPVELIPWEKDTMEVVK